MQGIAGKNARVTTAAPRFVGTPVSEFVSYALGDILSFILGERLDVQQ